MDLSPELLYFKDNIGPQEWNQKQQWSSSDSEGYSSLSPASSTDSFSFSPPYESCAFPKESYTNFNTDLPQTDRLETRNRSLTARKSNRKRMVCNQRQSASEREKMRMRNLSTALQNVRRYLPPQVAPAGKSLTKIETLRLTIRYISHLSEVLGLDEEILMKRREETIRRSRICPVGMNCFQGRMHELCPEATTTFPDVSSPSPSAYSPGLFEDQAGFQNMYIECQSSVPHTSVLGAAETPSYSPCAMMTSPIHDITQTVTQEDFTATSPISPDLGFCQNLIDDMWEELQEKDLWTSFQPPETAQPQQFC
ncbi:mesoderm posterior protein 1-like [Spea bombifrons]|uniref:mesoderm posterior protein 1-like n=1 Tax=Spea bombifrons TaxID=233779 RepID=UPI0023492D01|nr:mesoderm posterior protein 1-like [Spea bombifrons]